MKVIKRHNVLIVVSLLLFSLFYLTGCRKINIIKVEGYELVVSKNNTAAIYSLPEDVLNLDVYTIPNKIGEYEINQFGYEVRYFMGREASIGRLGNIKKIYIPNYIKEVNCDFGYVKVIKTDDMLSNIKFNGRYDFYEIYFLSPYDENYSNFKYITEDNIYDNLVYKTKDDKIEILASFGSDKIVIPDKINGLIVESIGQDAFSHTNVTEIVFGSEVKKISVNAFSYSQLTKVIIPDSIVEIENKVFDNCANLESVEIGTGIKSISKYCFSGCSKLKNVYFGDNTRTINEGAFSGCGFEELIIPDNILDISSGTFNGCKNLRKIILPKNLVILKNIVDHCPQLEEIYINEELHYFHLIGQYSTYEGLRLIEVDSKNKNFIVKDGILYDKDMTTIYMCPAKNNIKSVVIREKISKKAFENNIYIEEVIIESELENIPDYCFDNCTNLKKVVLNESVKVISHCAFFSCTNLENINLEHVNQIGTYSFADCTSLKDLKLNNVITISEYAFRDIAAASITFPNTLLKIERFAFHKCSNLKEVRLLNSNTNIEEHAFYDCKRIKIIK